MSSRTFFLICLYFGTRTSVCQTQNPNDTILEFFHNCKCVEYFECSVVNNYLIAARADLIPDPVICSDKHQVCCKKAPETDEPDGTTQAATDAPATKPTIPVTKPTTETAEIITTTMSPEVRGTKFTRDNCGIARTGIAVRILTPETDSATTVPGEIPWMVEIFRRLKPNKPYQFRCAGSLIHPKVVLTATHCVSAYPRPEVRVVASGREVFQNLGEREEDERDVVKIIKHPKFYSGGLHNDIALLILEKEYDFSGDLLNSICVPKANETFSTKCLAVGWGENKDLASIPLRKVDVPIVASQKCEGLLRKTRLGSEFELHSSFVCAGGEKGKDTCKGDGGSPLICLGDEYQYVQAGIVSWGVDVNDCGIVDQPGLYTNVPLFREWILDELKKNKIELGKNVPKVI